MQLICMTHRRATMERADLLYGITMPEPGLSQVVGVRVGTRSDEDDPMPYFTGC